MLALALAALCAAKTLDVVFIPDAPTAPTLVIAVDDAPLGGGKRTLSWALASQNGVLTDDVRPHDLFALPSAPRGATLSDRGGALSITIDDAGAWQDAVRTAVQAKVPALPLPGPTALRLVVDPTSNSAVLYGSDVKIAGRAVVRRDVVAVRAVVVAGKELIDVDGTAVDLVSACGRTVPSAVSAVSATSLKLLASGPVVCAGALAIIPVSGTKLDAKKDLAAAGVVVAR